MMISLAALDATCVKLMAKLFYPRGLALRLILRILLSYSILYVHVVKKTDGFVTDIIAFSDRKKYNNILEKDVEKLYTNEDSKFLF